MKRKSAFRFWFGGVVVTSLVAGGLLLRPSRSGVCYLLAFFLMWLGPGLARWLRARLPAKRKFLGLLQWSGPLVLVLTVVFRMFPPTSKLQFEQVGASSSLRIFLARVIDERDLSMGASAFFNATDVLPERGEILGPLFHETYNLMDRRGESVASPLIPTLLLGQSAESFDLLRYGVAEPQGTLVFLHGYGGNIASICWEVAQSARTAGYETLCPSTRTSGDWGSEHGAEILRATLALVAPGDAPVVLAGLSAGARGAARLAPRFRSEIDGLVLLAGASRRATRAGVPTLVIYGRRDAMFSPRVIRGYVERTGSRSLVLEGGHFIVLSERERVRPAMAEFLRARAPR